VERSDTGSVPGFVPTAGAVVLANDPRDSSAVSDNRSIGISDNPTVGRDSRRP
jgi:hypothetical protein